MKALTSNTGQSPFHLATGYSWSELPPSSTVVDIGGSEGHVSAVIAQRHPYLNFVVQDLPEVIQKASLPDDIGEGVRKRVRFESHDFFTEQTTQGEVFLLRWILHDWPDQQVVSILKNFKPVLKPGNKILINDQVMPDPGHVGAVVERQIRLVTLFQIRPISLLNPQSARPSHSSKTHSPVLQHDEACSQLEIRFST